VRKEPRRAAAIPSEDDDGDYLTPESLDPNKPEFPKLVDPPFRSANVPLELRPSDELKGGQATLDAPPVDAAALTVPASAAQYLREYQKEGVKWLYQQYIRQLGGVLGDDMVRLRS
jgi:SNF2 family DNA or RNA helicase